MLFHASSSVYDPARVAAAPRGRRSREPALADMLDDPIVAALMIADGVGRDRLEAELGRATARMIGRQQSSCDPERRA